MSLRWRVLFAMSVIAIMVVASAVATRALVERQLIEQIDHRLQPFAGPRDSRPDRGRPRGFDAVRCFGQGGGPGVSFYLAQLQGSTLTVCREAENGDGVLESPKLSVPQLQKIAASNRRYPITVGAARGGDLEYRVVVAPSDDGKSATIVAAPLNEVADSLSRLAWIVFTVAFVVLAALALVTWWVMRLGVRPVKRMAETAANVARTGSEDVDLSQRVDEISPGTEIGQLGRSLNTMLDRVQQSFNAQAKAEARLRQFVGDASHELRTPVQTIRGYAELYRLGALNEPTKLEDAMRRSEQEAVRMASLVDDLLTLARFDNERPLRKETVDVTELVRDAVANVGAIQPQRSITLDSSESVVVIGDDHALRQVFANVIGNALAHTPVGSAVGVSVHAADDRCVVVVSDAGPGMDPSIAGRAFERFVRADQARTRHAGGSGLGLAIVQSTVEAHGGTVVLQSDVLKGTTVTISLPLAI